MNFPIGIFYSQMNICDSESSIFSLWSKEHVAQGFAWRDGTVSFGIPDHDGMCFVETKLVKELKPLNENVIRAIRVPLTIKHRTFVATVIDRKDIDIPAEEYSLEFRLLSGSLVAEKDEFGDPYAYLIQFFFLPGKSDVFEILRASDEMSTDKVLTKTAEPA